MKRGDLNGAGKLVGGLDLVRLVVGETESLVQMLEVSPGWFRELVLEPFHPMMSLNVTVMLLFCYLIRRAPSRSRRSLQNDLAVQVLMVPAIGALVRCSTFVTGLR